MASDQSWNLKGLKPELRETAREAARRKGISVNEWLQSVILESAAEDASPAPEDPPAAPARRPGPRAAQTESHPAATHEGMRAISSRLTELTEQLDRLSRPRAETPVAPTRQAPAAAPNVELSSTLRAIERRLAALSATAPAAPQLASDHLNDVLARLDRRLDTLAQEGRATSTELERRIAAVDQALSVLNPAPSSRQTASPIPSPPATHAPILEPSTFGLDRAMAEIAERQRALDADEEPGALRQQFTALSQRLDVGAPRQPAETFAAETRATETSAAGTADAAAGLQDELRQLTAELRTLRRPGGFGHAIDGLREELAQIGLKLTEAAPRRAVQAVETEVRALADRVDQGRQRGVDASALAGIEKSLALVHDALHQLAPAESLAEVREEVRALDRRIETIAAGATDAADNTRTLHLLARSVAELREIAAHAASGDALIALAEEVQALGDKVDRLPAPTAASLEPELSSILEQRFQELADHLDARAQANDAGASGQLAAMVEHIATKLDRIELGGDNSPMLDAIARQITRLTEHVEQSDARFEAFEHLGASMRDLLEGMEQMRSGAVIAAERVAKEAALEVARQSAAPPIEIEGLRNDLEALRSGQVQSDRRTQDTLEAVHDTLERLVDRLAVVETDLRSPSETHAAPALRSIQPSHAPTLAPAPPFRSASPPTEPARRAPTAVVAEAPAIGLSPQDRRPIDPDLPADHPLEPGAVTARGRAPVTAAERIAASEAALGPAKPITEADAKSNFIAAARRAAQAAANMSPPAEAQAGNEKRASSTFGALAQKFTGRRSLVLGLILVIGVGAIHLLIKNTGSHETAQMEPTLAPITATVPPAPRATATATVQAPASPTATSASATTASATPQVPRPERSFAGGPGAAAHEPAPPAPPADATMPGISPLTIASIQIPTADITSSIGRGHGPAAKPAGATAATPSIPAAPGSAATEPPGAVSKGLRTAALAGNPAAEYELATRYAEGRGVALNFEEAARWFERAANRDLAPAQYRLGSLYEKGQGVKKDLDQARRLYRAASEKGNAKAMHNLAVLYAEGIDGKPDFNSAGEWFRKAAARGVADSQYNLGILFARGLGVEQNLAESYKWFALAAQGGDLDAGKKRDDVAARLDQQALIAARLATQTFTPEPQPEEAITVKPSAGGWDAAPAAASKPKGGPGAPRKIKSS